MNEPKPVISDEDINKLWRQHGHIPHGYMTISRRLLAEFAERVANQLSVSCMYLNNDPVGDHLRCVMETKEAARIVREAAK